PGERATFDARAAELSAWLVRPAPPVPPSVPRAVLGSSKRAPLFTTEDAAVTMARFQHHRLKLEAAAIIEPLAASLSFTDYPAGRARLRSLGIAIGANNRADIDPDFKARGKVNQVR